MFGIDSPRARNSATARIRCATPRARMRMRARECVRAAHCIACATARAAQRRTGERATLASRCSVRRQRTPPGDRASRGRGRRREGRPLWRRAASTRRADAEPCRPRKCPSFYLKRTKFARKSVDNKNVRRLRYQLPDCVKPVESARAAKALCHRAAPCLDPSSTVISRQTRGLSESSS